MAPQDGLILSIMHGIMVHITIIMVRVVGQGRAGPDHNLQSTS
jgi:hypothetical protein